MQRDEPNRTPPEPPMEPPGRAVEQQRGVPRPRGARFASRHLPRRISLRLLGYDYDYPLMIPPPAAVRAP